MVMHHKLPDFASTRHLPCILNPSAITRLDTVATAEEAQSIFFGDDHPVEVTEKIDGANCGIYAFPAINPDVVMVRNRSHILSRGFTAKTPAQAQWASIWGWVYEHREAFERLACTVNGVVYGEWMHFVHGMAYTRLPAKFIAHSLWDMDEKLWVCPSLARGLLTAAGFSLPAVLTTRPASLEELADLAKGPAQWAEGCREGVYVKVGDGRRTTHRFKLVGPDFEPGKHFGSGARNKVVSGTPDKSR